MSPDPDCGRAVGAIPGPPFEVAFVALGSNLGQRARHLANAVAALEGDAWLHVYGVSPVYETAPVGPPPQGPYLNAVVALRSWPGPRGLLAKLLAIEAAAGRVRGPQRFEARTLDCDLLLYGARRLSMPELELPHPRLHERAFVLEPLADLAPGLVHPRLGVSVRELAARVRDPEGVRRWDGWLPAPDPSPCPGPRPVRPPHPTSAAAADARR